MRQDEIPYEVNQTDVMQECEWDTTAACSDVDYSAARERLRVRHGQGGDLDAVREIGVVQSGDGVGVQCVNGPVGVMHGDTRCERARGSGRG